MLNINSLESILSNIYLTYQRQKLTKLIKHFNLCVAVYGALILIPTGSNKAITETIIEPHTLQHVLLHLNLVELIGANDDAVVGEVNTATGFQGLNLLK